MIVYGTVQVGGTSSPVMVRFDAPAGAAEPAVHPCNTVLAVTVGERVVVAWPAGSAAGALPCILGVVQ